MNMPLDLVLWNTSTHREFFINWLGLKEVIIRGIGGIETTYGGDWQELYKYCIGETNNE